jgi:hypothetical protein
MKAANGFQKMFCKNKRKCHSAGMFMPAWAPIVMKMNFVVVPSGADPEGSTTKAIFVVIFFCSQQASSISKNSLSPGLLNTVKLKYPLAAFIRWSKFFSSSV